jgi:hypothetical protein
MRLGWMAVIALATALGTGNGTAAWAAGPTLAATALLDAMPDDRPAPVRPLTDGEIQSAACVLTSTATMAATYAVGPTEIIMVVVGGLLTPSKSSTLFLSLMGTMAAAGCGLGSALAPAAMWAARQSSGAGDRLAQLGHTLGTGVSGALAALTGAPVTLADAAGVQ